MKRCPPNPKLQLCWLVIAPIIAVTATSEVRATTIYSVATVADNVTVGADPAIFLNDVLEFAFNNAGTAVFSVGSLGQVSIYTGNGGALNLVVADNGNMPPGIGTQTHLSGGGVGINDSGVVAYWMSTTIQTASSTSTTEGIYTSNGTVVYSSANQNTFPISSEPTPINNNGQVAFLIGLGSGNEAIYRGSGGPPATIASESGNGFSGGIDAAISMNGSGTVVFHASGPDGVYTGSGGALTTIYSGDYQGGPSINNSGNVVFSLPDQQILIGNGGSLTPYATGYEPRINDLGEVAYQDAKTDIIVGTDPVNDQVVEIGEPLDGSTIADIRSFHLNDAGQIAFMADLANGNEGLFIATPVPEPSTVAMGAVFAVVLALAGVYRRTSGNRLAPPNSC